MDSWIKIYKGIKDYLFIALLDHDNEIAQDSQQILMKFFGITALTDKVIEESGDIVLRTLEVAFPAEKGDVEI